MADDKRVKELKEKVTAVVNDRFGGDWTKAFNHYAARSGNAGLVEPGDLRKLLEDANIGNGITRGKWVEGVMKKVDVSNDKAISWDEFQKALSTGG